MCTIHYSGQTIKIWIDIVFSILWSASLNKTKHWLVLSTGDPIFLIANLNRELLFSVWWGRLLNIKIVKEQSSKSQSQSSTHSALIVLFFAMLKTFYNFILVIRVNHTPLEKFNSSKVPSRFLFLCKFKFSDQYCSYDYVFENHEKGHINPPKLISEHNVLDRLPLRITLRILKK